MPDEESKDEAPVVSDGDVVDQLLTDLGVDDDMRKELKDSGRMSSDVVRVESAKQVRRRMDIEKSAEQLRDSMRMVERNLMTIEGMVDKVERDIVPVILSFLVGLKGNLVNLRTSIIGRSKRRAKTNLQSTYVETEVKSIVDEEFSTIEETLTTEMSTPILEKVRDIVEGLKSAMGVVYSELGTLKANYDDYTQRATTEVEFLSKQLSLKPKVEIPKEVADQIKQLERKVEEGDRDLTIASQKLENREAQISQLQKTITELKVENENLERSVAELRSAPTVGADELTEIRQKLTASEASKEVISEKLSEAIQRAEQAEARIKEIHAQLSKRELESDDARTKIVQIEQELKMAQERLAEMDELRARIRSYESGEKIRELDRIRAEYERIEAAHARMQKEHDKMSSNLDYTTRRLEGYIGVMQATPKTKAFLMLEDSKELKLREVARSLGVSPAVAREWVEDFERLGIAKLLDDDTLVLTIAKEEPDKSK